jgi:hypothetical protein
MACFHERPTQPCDFQSFENLTVRGVFPTFNQRNFRTKWRRGSIKVTDSTRNQIERESDNTHWLCRKTGEKLGEYALGEIKKHREGHQRS